MKAPPGTEDLESLARKARRRARAPYSRYAVGAALKTRRGEIVTGCNVENASYSLGVCAERVAVLKAVSEGLKGFESIVVVVDAEDPVAPCGACRQVLWELCGDLWVHMATVGGRRTSIPLSRLLPIPFDERSLKPVATHPWSTRPLAASRGHRNGSVGSRQPGSRSAPRHGSRSRARGRGLRRTRS